MSIVSSQLIFKADVAQRLGVSERTIEKLVKAKRFPPALKLGKNAMWAANVVEHWLEQALVPQQTWTPPPVKKSARTTAR